MDTESATPEFLTQEECLEIDKSMLPARDRFSARVAVYAMRSLKQVSAEEGIAIEDLNAQQIGNWISRDPNLTTEKGFDGNFKGFFLQLVIASMRPLRAMSQEFDTPIESLTIPQVVAWFKKEADQRIGTAEEAP
ncbi:MAG: hypothetical protein AAFY26_26365 [Cyanobacteria bacterium J06638_22]